MSYASCVRATRTCELTCCQVNLRMRIYNSDLVLLGVLLLFENEMLTNCTCDVVSDVTTEFVLMISFACSVGNLREHSFCCGFGVRDWCVANRMCSVRVCESSLRCLFLWSQLGGCVFAIGIC